MSTPTFLTPSATITATADLIAAASRWMLTDQAAIMRQLPEQRSAYQWWTSAGRDHADSVITVPAWINHFYGETVTANPAHPTLTPTAAAVAELLRTRAAELSSAPIYLIEDSRVLAALVALTQSHYYRDPDPAWPTGQAAGTVMLAAPVPIRQGDIESSDVPPSATLHGWTWFTRPGQIRVLDWIHPALTDTGIADVDAAIRTHVRPADLPPMLSNGEWSHPVAETCPTQVSRARLAAATADLAASTMPSRDADCLTDPDTLLVPRLAAAAADALNAGLFTLTEHHVRRRRGQREAPRRASMIRTLTAR